MPDIKRIAPVNTYLVRLLEDLRKGFVCHEDCGWDECDYCVVNEQSIKQLDAIIALVNERKV